MCAIFLEDDDDDDDDCYVKLADIDTWSRHIHTGADELITVGSKSR